MKRSSQLWARLLGSVLLLSAVLLLAVRFGQLQTTPNPGSMHFPGGEDLVSDYSALIGSRVELYGRVVSTDPIVIEGRYDDRELAVAVVDVSTSPSVGEYLHVYGVVEPNHQIRALDTVVYPAKGIQFTYAVSAIAAIWTVARFLNQWRFDTRTYAFGHRTEPLIHISLLERLRNIVLGDNA